MHRRHDPRGAGLGLLLALGLAGPAAAHSGPPLRAAVQPPGERYTGYTEPEAARSPVCGSDVCVHWVTEGADAPPPLDEDGDDVPDYVRRVADAAGSSLAAQTAALPLGLGWPQPVGDGELGGGTDETDVYVAALESRGGAAYFDPGQTGHHRSGYAWVHNDLPERLIDIVTTHELNHVLQSTADAYQQLWMMESTASWAEDELHPETDPGRAKIAAWAARTEEPMTGGSVKQYGSRVWNRWLAARYGRGVIRDAWVGSPLADPRQLSAPAYGSAVGPGGTFVTEFVRFAAATAEWRLGSSAFALGGELPGVERVGGLSAGGQDTRTLDHTTFALLEVAPPADDRPLVLEAQLPAGVAGGLALVGREGDERTGSERTSLLDLPEGGTGSVRLDAPTRFSRITAVLVNADATAASGHGSAADYRDAQPVRATLAQADGPPPATSIPAPPGGGATRPPEPAAAPVCGRRPPGSVRSTQRTWIARAPGGVVTACMIGRRPVVLAGSKGPRPAGPFRLAGSFAAFRLRGGALRHGSVVLVDLRDGRRRELGRARGRLVRLLLSARGRVVWVEREGRRHRLLIGSLRAARIASLDRRLRPASVRLRSGRVVWRSGRRLRSARL